MKKIEKIYKTIKKFKFQVQKQRSFSLSTSGVAPSATITGVGV
jgi:hypothetical protein